MPFRVKKRPNPLQAAMAGFMQGATQGAQYGLQATLLKKKEDKEKDEKDRKSTIGLLQKTAMRVYDPERKAEIDKLIFDIGTGVKPISDAYAFMQGITPEAYVKPEKIDFTKAGGTIDKRNATIAKMKAQHEQKMRSSLVDGLDTDIRIAEREAMGKANMIEPIPTKEEVAGRKKLPVGSPAEKNLDQYNKHVDKLYKQAIDPKNKDNIGYMSKEQYIEEFLDPRVKDHGARIKAELMQQSGYFVPPSALGEVDHSLDQKETQEETGEVFVDKTTGIKYQYIGGNKADSSSYRALN
jgi:hypothetical protein|tara:strand:+ start:1138 stop:2025 length:888 start_codon:yes stop_codon:yes gene_type:complete